jgi:hypothetical protein
MFSYNKRIRTVLQNALTGQDRLMAIKPLNISQKYIPRAYGDISEVSYIPGAGLYSIKRLSRQFIRAGKYQTI